MRFVIQYMLRTSDPGSASHNTKSAFMPKADYLNKLKLYKYAEKSITEKASK